MNNNTKICNKCKVEKDKGDFYKGKRLKDGLQSICKSCDKNYREDNKIAIAHNKKLYYENHKDEILQYHKDYYKNNRDDIIFIQKEYRKNNKNKIVDNNIIYYKKNKTNIDLKNKEYYKNNKERLIAVQKEYYLNHKDEIDNYRREYYKNRMKNDLLFKIKRRVSNQIWRSLFKNGSSKDNKSICDFLPYSIEELKLHLENKFDFWMNWNNYGKYVVENWNDNDTTTWKWQIDHIIPHSKFKYISMENQEFKDCWALSNLRPYSAKQNLLDSNREKNENNEKK